MEEVVPKGVPVRYIVPFMVCWTYSDYCAVSFFFFVDALKHYALHLYPNSLLPSVCFRLVAFNLGYLPCGDKATITKSETTLQALEAAKRILTPGGLISLVVYVGHPGGR